MPLTAIDRELVELRKPADTPKPSTGFRMWRNYTRSWVIVTLIMHTAIKIFGEESWSHFAFLVGVPILTFLLTRYLRKLYVAVKQARTLRYAYLTPADLPSSMSFNFAELYRRADGKGTDKDREQLRLLCNRVTVEALRLKAADVPLDHPEFSAWLQRKYDEADKLSQYIIDFSSGIAASMAAEAARRKEEILRLKQEAALEAFRARNVEGPVNTAEWTSNGLEKTLDLFDNSIK